jgi:RNA polymerase sigma-70 factor (ECF subfamily)
VLWEKADSFQIGTSFWAWASQIARFKVLNHIRGYSRERLVFDFNALESLAIVAEKKLSRIDDQREALDHCLKGLMPAQRQILDLRYTSDYSIERIAETIGRPAGSIRQTLYRIRLALLACMEEQLAPGRPS